MLIHLDLFSGIGGFSLSAKWAAIPFDKTYYSDIDVFANKVYAKNFPDAVPIGDITKIDWLKLKEEHVGAEFIVTGGFPCQPHSIAGKRKGSEDERDLWSECQRTLRDIRPKFAIFENVPGLFISNGGQFFNRVLSDISEVGYDAEWQIIPASFVGAPHRRDRVWIITYPNEERRRGRRFGEYVGEERRGDGFEGVANNGDKVWRETEGLCDAPNSNVAEQRHNTRTDTGEKRSLRWGNESDVFARQAQYVRDSESTGLSRSEYRQREGEHGRTGERISWRKNEWTEIATELCRVDDGVQNRMDRLKCLGNSIVPQVAQILWLLIKPHLNLQ